mmetsp:Transcript_20394/g.70663  ORF Transcript_20394/g.70663 Transcript_20394/m.70663 type:complete len:342 (+) Transcript_20394:110-1135(+)
MARAQVKNTFWEFVADEATAAARPSPTALRSKSAEATRSPTDLLTDETEHFTSQMKRLSAMLSPKCSSDSPAEAAAVPSSPEREAVRVTSIASKQAWRPRFQRDGAGELSKELPAASTPKVTTSSLKTVYSNSSVSTMAPQDWDAAEDEEEAEDRQWNALQWGRSDGGSEMRGTADQWSYRHYSAPRIFQHANVPKSQNLAEEFSKANLETPPTTMMVRNIPNRYTQRELIRELETLGFAGSFDFFYAPIDTGSMGNVGYAFVNFVTGDWADHCLSILSGYTFKKHQQKARTKVATVSVAHLQGLEANLRHYENSAVNGRARSKRCGPVVMTSIASAITIA